MRTHLRFSLLSHIHIHAKSQDYFADKAVKKSGHKMSRLSFLGLIDSLESIVKSMKWEAKGTEWSDYYQDTNYTSNGFEHKKQIVSEYLDKTKPNTVWDLGANVGIFSHIAADRGIQTLSFDIDPAAVEKNYLRCVSKNETTILPLLVDLTNPSPAIGWENEERMSLFERGPADTVFALALIHHLAISNNLPLNKIAKFFNSFCRSLIIEFIPKDDSQVKRLLTNREDIFPDYSEKNFEYEFKKYFKILDSERIKDSERTMYLMEKESA
jgi:ribosomal protein L11 methylase PrmA